MKKNRKLIDSGLYVVISLGLACWSVPAVASFVEGSDTEMATHTLRDSKILEQDRSNTKLASEIELRAKSSSSGSECEVNTKARVEAPPEALVIAGKAALDPIAGAVEMVKNMMNPKK